MLHFYTWLPIVKEEEITVLVFFPSNHYATSVKIINAYTLWLIDLLAEIQNHLQDYLLQHYLWDISTVPLKLQYTCDRILWSLKHTGELSIYI